MVSNAQLIPRSHKFQRYIRIVVVARGTWNAQRSMKNETDNFISMPSRSIQFCYFWLGKAAAQMTQLKNNVINAVARIFQEMHFIYRKSVHEISECAVQK